MGWPSSDATKGNRLLDPKHISLALFNADPEVKLEEQVETSFYNVAAVEVGGQGPGKFKDQIVVG